MPEIGENISPFEAFSTKGMVFQFPHDLTKSLVIFVVYRKNQCTPCKAQLEFLKEEYQQIFDAGAEVLAISYPPIEETKKMVSELNLPYIILSDPQGKILALLGAINVKKLQSGGVIHSGLIYPTIFILNRGGKVLFKLVTKKTASQEEMKEILKTLTQIKNTGNG